jgi:predicted phage terminase large subunit-like protein
MDEAERKRVAIEALAMADAAEKILAERSLYQFVKQAWPHCNTAGPYVDNWHVKLLSDHLQAVFEGKIKNLLINIPPGLGKSILSNVIFPAWCWTRDPTYRILCATYGEEVTLKDAGDCRDLVKSQWFQSRYGRTFQIREGRDSLRRFDTDKGGWRLSTSVGGRGTGYHPSCILCDDLHKADHAKSPAELSAAIEFWSGTLGSRGILTNCSRVLIGQRICRGDVSAHALSQRKFVHVSLPMEYVPGAMQPTPFGADPRTEPGTLLFPQLATREKVDELKQDLGFRVAAQLQQDPAPPEGALFDQKNFRRCELKGETEWGNSLPRGQFFLKDIEGNQVGEPVSPKDCYWFQTLDYAAKTKSINDYTVGGTFAVTPNGDIIVYHIHRERIKIPKQFAMAMALRQRFPFISEQAVEDASGGTSVIQEGEDKGIDFHVLRAITDKIDRAGPIARYYQNGKVYHLDGEPWLPDFEVELLQFPQAGPGVHDDQVDVAAWAGQLVLERSLSRAGVMQASKEGIDKYREKMKDLLKQASGESSPVSFGLDKFTR